MSSGHRFCTDRSGNGDQGKRTEDDDVRFAQSFEKLILMAKSKEGAQLQRLMIKKIRNR